MKLTEDSFVPDLFDADIVHDLITIIGNLVTNSLVSLEKAAVKELFLKILHTDDRLFIEVRDTERGMDQKQINLIYENGYSTKGENRGLGLYITKRSLTHLNGTIYVLSELDQGTIFYVSLPYRSKERFFD